MAAPSPIPVERLSTVIGALIHADDLANAGVGGPARLRRLLVEHHVVFIRGFGTDRQRFCELAHSLGDLMVHPLQSFTGREQAVTVIEDSPAHPAAGFPWHTDLTWMEEPPRFGVLQALEIPAIGGDTLWASLTAAYEALSPPLQALCSELSGVHTIDATLRRTIVDRYGHELADRFQAAHPPVQHPLVGTHADTGASFLFLNPMYLERIVELRPEESKVLLSLLQDVATDPNHSLRWRWREGDVAIWDEACTLHRALVDHNPSVRRMRRCTVAGEWAGPSPGITRSFSRVPAAGRRAVEP
jgi:taurine dioxygenase